MNQLSNHFTFHPVDPSQRELIHAWLKQDYIRAWIHGAGLQSTLSGLEKSFELRDLSKEAQRQSAFTQHWIGCDHGKPFVYLLTSNVFPGEGSEYAKYRKTNGLAITLDIFIGDPSYVGKGLADRVVKEFLVSHFSDIAEVFIDPEQSNTRAVHVYQKIGFQIVGEFLAPWHPVPHYIMRLGMSSLLSKSKK